MLIRGFLGFPPGAGSGRRRLGETLEALQPLEKLIDVLIFEEFGDGKLLAGTIGFDHHDLAAQQDDGGDLAGVEFLHDLVDGNSILEGFGEGDFLLGAIRGDDEDLAGAKGFRGEGFQIELLEVQPLHCAGDGGGVDTGLGQGGSGLLDEFRAQQTGWRRRIPGLRLVLQVMNRVGRKGDLGFGDRTLVKELQGDLVTRLGAGDEHLQLARMNQQLVVPPQQDVEFLQFCRCGGAVEHEFADNQPGAGLDVGELVPEVVRDALGDHAEIRVGFAGGGSDRGRGGFVGRRRGRGRDGFGMEGGVRGGGRSLRLAGGGPSGGGGCAEEGGETVGDWFHDWQGWRGEPVQGAWGKRSLRASLCIFGGLSRFRLVRWRERGQTPAMRMSLLLSLLLVLPCHAGREKFAKEKYSLDFPADWKKPAEDAGAALIARENKDGTALFVVTKMPVAKGGTVDLDATTKAIADGYKKDLKLKDDPKVEPGEVDGLKSRFLVIASPKSDKKEGEEDKDAAKDPSLAMFLVVIDAKTEVIILQATLAKPVAKKTSEACLAIIQSFKREE